MNNEIMTVVQLNEVTKRVVEESRRLYLTSLNAMFNARQAGGRAMGFNTVTAELRSFSRKMNGRMESLRGRIEAMVCQVSEMQKQRRQSHLIERAAAESERLHARGMNVAAFASRSRARLAEARDSFAGNRKYFALELHGAQMLCTIGENLAVQARVEAMSAGSPAAVAQLTHVAVDVAETVARIQESLRAAARQLRNLEEQS